MAQPVHYHPNLIFSPGTQVVALRDIVGPNGRTLHPRGAVGVVVKSPVDLQHSYRIRFPDGFEESLPPSELALLAKHKEGAIGARNAADPGDLLNRVAFRCIVGSQAFGLADDASDIDRRGFYIPPAELQWSLYGVPEQLELDESQEAYWELQKFIVLALKANPNVLECLYSPLVEKATPLAQQLLDMRSIFLSRLVYQTYNGYAMSQFKKMQSDIRSQGTVKWKHVMHLIRLLISGIRVLQEETVPVDVGPHRERLLAIKRGELPWEETEAWRRQLHAEFDAALQATCLPERPDYEQANAFLIAARKAALAEELP
ncbi:nucleotidyltransferase domain-containing protein [Blastopirellula sp. JC732]|uniref:Nucleotidyltransferase domain-containing protein n=1 Tax=Blastopirellula sediminis TaxID=2894196 RepID=A0A9X1MIZ6_9BACT|nr:nucleotidyltransferase domain-containing protein [Blastopirellula sediminis]MCC9607771.1 nucleotidyltransferase domain-containing protein [Blastopirellula sediminis]MCC9627436.1 nucleotidyltransferase domain-containing protein [Blastopirellula sediminis]